jgi:hypothetical protein
MPTKLKRPSKLCLKENYSKVHINKHLPDAFLTQKGMRKVHVLSLIFNFSSQYAIGKFQNTYERSKMYGTQQVLVYADDINILGGKRYITGQYRGRSRSK